MSTVSISGAFTEFDIDVEGRDFSRIHVSIPVTSIDTENIRRDDHLKSEAFLDARNHPYITFESTSFRPVNEEKWLLEGVLTIRGVSKNVVIDVEHGGEVTDDENILRTGFSLETTIDRRDFGLDWDAKIEEGYVVENEVKITGDVVLMWMAGEGV
jgi:polyisoprenoid-binding protein YceI